MIGTAAGWVCRGSGWALRSEGFLDRAWLRRLRRDVDVSVGIEKTGMLTGRTLVECDGNLFGTVGSRPLLYIGHLDKKKVHFANAARYLRILDQNAIERVVFL